MIVNKYIELLNGVNSYAPTYGCSPFMHGTGFQASHYLRKYYSSSVTSPYIIAIRDNQSISVLSERLGKLSAAEMFQRYLENPKLVEIRAAQFDDFSVRVQEIYQNHQYLAIETMTLVEVANTAQQLHESLCSESASMFFTLYFDKAFCIDLLKGASQSPSVGDLEAVWESAITPVHPSFDKEQYCDVAKLVAAGFDWSHIAERCQYIGASYSEVLSVAKLEQLLRRQYVEFQSPEAAGALHDAYLRESASAMHVFGEWRNSLTDQQRILCDYIQTIISLRDRRKNVFGRCLTVLWRLAERMFSKAGLDNSLIPYYTLSELAKGLDYLIAHARELELRRRGFVLMIDNEGVAKMQLSDFEPVKNIIEQHYHSHRAGAVERVKDAINGQVACRGYAKGRARLALSFSDIVAPIEPGDILVTGMTRPEFVPVMKTCQAIVTDEGGITCHAAILSREFKIPCIIGTKVATRIIKDGDTIIVDAFAGVVSVCND